MFSTFRLHGTLPKERHFSAEACTSGEAFAAMDRLLDEARCGPRYLQMPEVAEIIQSGIQRLTTDGLGDVHAWVVMSNHVHLLMTPRTNIIAIMQELKGRTAFEANRRLALTGQRFWQEESYDRLVRHGDEFRQIGRYIEANPVKAGLVQHAEEFRWSSAWRRGGLKPAAG